VLAKPRSATPRRRQPRPGARRPRRAGRPPLLRQPVGTDGAERLGRPVAFTPSNGRFQIGLDEQRLPASARAASLRGASVRATPASSSTGRASRSRRVRTGIDRSTPTPPGSSSSPRPRPRAGREAGPLTLTTVPPDLTDEERQQLGIHHQLTTFTTQMGAS